MQVQHKNVDLAHVEERALGIEYPDVEFEDLSTGDVSSSPAPLCKSSIGHTQHSGGAVDSMCGDALLDGISFLNEGTMIGFYVREHFPQFPTFNLLPACSNQAVEDEILHDHVPCQSSSGNTSSVSAQPLVHPSNAPTAATQDS